MFSAVHDYLRMLQNNPGKTFFRSCGAMIHDPLGGAFKQFS